MEEEPSSSTSLILADLGPFEEREVSLSSSSPESVVLKAGRSVSSVDLCWEKWDNEVVLAVATLTNNVSTAKAEARGLASVPSAFADLAKSSQFYQQSAKEFLGTTTETEVGEIQIWKGQRLAYAFDELAVSVSFLGRDLATVSREGCVRVYRPPWTPSREARPRLYRLRPVFEAGLNGALFCCVKWGEKNKLLAAGANDGSLAVYDVSESSGSDPVAVFEGVRHDRSKQTGCAVRCVAWKSSDQVALFSESGWFQLWQLGGKSCQFPVFETRFNTLPMASGIEFLQNCDAFVTCQAQSATVSAVSLKTFKTERWLCFDYEKDAVFSLDSVAIDDHVTRLLAAGSDGTARLVQATDGKSPKVRIILRILRDEDGEDRPASIRADPSPTTVEDVVRAAFARLKEQQEEGSGVTKSRYRVVADTSLLPNKSQDLLAPAGLSILSARIGRGQATGYVACGAQCGLVALLRVDDGKTPIPTERKKPPGRPRKYPPKSAASPDAPKRKRGRPRKTTNEEVDEEGKSPSQKEKSLDGRAPDEDDGDQADDEQRGGDEA